MLFQHQILLVWKSGGTQTFFCKATGHQRVTEGPPCCPSTKHPHILAKGTAVGGATVSSNSCHSMGCTKIPWLSEINGTSIFCSEKLGETHPKQFEMLLRNSKTIS